MTESEIRIPVEGCKISDDGTELIIPIPEEGRIIHARHTGRKKKSQFKEVTTYRLHLQVTGIHL